MGAGSCAHRRPCGLRGSPAPLLFCPHTLSLNSRKGGRDEDQGPVIPGQHRLRGAGGRGRREQAQHDRGRGRGGVCGAAHAVAWGRSGAGWSMQPRVRGDLSVRSGEVRGQVCTLCARPPQGLCRGGRRERPTSARRETGDCPLLPPPSFRLAFLHFTDRDDDDADDDRTLHPPASRCWASPPGHPPCHSPPACLPDRPGRDCGERDKRG